MTETETGTRLGYSDARMLGLSRWYISERSVYADSTRMMRWAVPLRCLCGLNIPIPQNFSPAHGGEGVDSSSKEDEV